MPPFVLPNHRGQGGATPTETEICSNSSTRTPSLAYNLHYAHSAALGIRVGVAIATNSPRVCLVAFLLQECLLIHAHVPAAFKFFLTTTMGIPGRTSDEYVDGGYVDDVSLDT